MDHEMRKFDNVTIVQAPFEADPFIVKLAQEQEFYAVVSTDTDFVIFNKFNGSISPSSIRIVSNNDAQASNNNKEIYATRIQSSDVASLLQTQYLAELACLCGNDYIDATLLNSFHTYAIKKFNIKNVTETVRAVALYLRDKQKEYEKLQQEQQQQDTPSTFTSYLFSNALADGKYSGPQLVQLQSLLDQVYLHYSACCECEDDDSEKNSNVEPQQQKQFDEELYNGKFKNRLVDKSIVSITHFHSISFLVPFENVLWNETCSHYLWTSFRYRMYAFMLYAPWTSKAQDSNSIEIAEFLTLNQVYKKCNLVITRKQYEKEQFNISSATKQATNVKLEATMHMLDVFGITKKQASQLLTLFVQNKNIIDICYLPLIIVTRKLKELHSFNPSVKFQEWEYELLLAAFCGTVVEKPVSAKSSSSSTNVFTTAYNIHLLANLNVGLEYAHILNQFFDLPVGDMAKLILKFSGSHYASLCRRSKEETRRTKQYDNVQVAMLLQNESERAIFKILQAGVKLA